MPLTDEEAYRELIDIQERLSRMLREGPNEIDEKWLKLASPTPRGRGDLSRAIHHIGTLESAIRSRLGSHRAFEISAEWRAQR